MRSFRRALAGSAIATGFAFAGAGAASAQPEQNGLVNVFAEDTTVQIPVAIAANVCGVSANVLAQAANVGDIDCTAEGVSLAEDSDGGGGSSPRQTGLINVALVDTTVQVPVAVAANICGVAVNVLAAALNAGEIDCEALAESCAGA
jgi:hypothetical protein